MNIKDLNIRDTMRMSCSTFLTHCGPPLSRQVFATCNLLLASLLPMAAAPWEGRPQMLQSCVAGCHGPELTVQWSSAIHGVFSMLSSDAQKSSWYCSIGMSLASYPKGSSSSLATIHSAAKPPTTMIEASTEKKT